MAYAQGQQSLCRIFNISPLRYRFREQAIDLTFWNQATSAQLRRTYLALRDPRAQCPMRDG